MLDKNAVAKLRRFMELRDKRDQDKKAAAASEKEYRDAETDVYEALEENPIAGTIKVDLGAPWGIVSFLPRTTYFGRVVDQDQALTYYEQRAMEEVTAPKFVMKRINDEVRDRLEQGKSMPPGIDYYAKRGVTITRQKD